jgi:hypothetical protein
VLVLRGRRVWRVWSHVQQMPARSIQGERRRFVRRAVVRVLPGGFLPGRQGPGGLPAVRARKIPRRKEQQRLQALRGQPLYRELFQPRMQILPARAIRSAARKRRVQHVRHGHGFCRRCLSRYVYLQRMRAWVRRTSWRQSVRTVRPGVVPGEARSGNMRRVRSRQVELIHWLKPARDVHELQPWPLLFRRGRV